MKKETVAWIHQIKTGHFPSRMSFCNHAHTPSGFLKSVVCTTATNVASHNHSLLFLPLMRRCSIFENVSIEQSFEAVTEEFHRCIAATSVLGGLHHVRILGDIILSRMRRLERLNNI